MKTCRKRPGRGLASLMRPQEAASDAVRGESRYAAAPTRTAAVIAAFRARWHLSLRRYTHLHASNCQRHHDADSIMLAPTKAAVKHRAQLRDLLLPFAVINEVPAPNSSAAGNKTVGSALNGPIERDA